ncbi:hypothetical protein EYS42_11020 [Aquabacterium lacunae]|uniref:Uncharacterized protein n=1 Tax=Aquabacterium lacunae TaxID=2528630 RepID=A0A4Q9H465_9BURK|nr:hypothetical protein [Aquabacterium lacunae]TBO30221.1 hypothetical protein EYS42_11020 [Aquabacterium lacunae]
MSERQQEPKTETAGTSRLQSPVSRRDLMRAGLAAAPVLAAVQSDLVLASTSAYSTVRPSCYASFVASHMSAAPGRTTTGSYLPLADCRTRCSTSPGDWRFLVNSLYSHCGFKSYTGCGFSSTATLRSVMHVDPVNTTSAQVKLGVYLAAAYLSAHLYGGNSFITMAQVRAIWENKGVWSPVAGVNWDLPTTLQYFARVYSTQPGQFAPCLINSTTSC